MIKVKLTVLWIVLKAIIKKILKYISTPFLYVWFILKWIYIILFAAGALIVMLIVSVLKGDWRVK